MTRLTVNFLTFLVLAHGRGGGALPRKYCMGDAIRVGLGQGIPKGMQITTVLPQQNENQARPGGSRAEQDKREVIRTA